MKKFKENNPIDIIEALCQMGNTENVGTFEMPWSKDNSEQIERIRWMFIPNLPGEYVWQVMENDSQIIEDDKAYPEIGMAYTPGFYLYSYNEELPTSVIDTYTMKVEIQKEGLDCNTEIYLYYIGD